MKRLENEVRMKETDQGNETDERTGEFVPKTE